jgi:hypothetical protein
MIDFLLSMDMGDSIEFTFALLLLIWMLTALVATGAAKIKLNREIKRREQERSQLNLWRVSSPLLVPV